MKTAAESAGRRRQDGVTTVEFAIVSVVLMVLLFGVIEFGRLVFTYSVLNEGVRRAARLGAVCHVNNGNVAQAAIFASLPGLSASDVHVEYLASNGTVIASPTSAANIVNIRYVRVRIGGYQHQLAIPFVGSTITMPEFSATFPRESLGGGGTTSC